MREKLLKIIIEIGGQVVFEVKILKVFYCHMTIFMCLLHGGSWITVTIFFHTSLVKLIVEHCHKKER